MKRRTYLGAVGMAALSGCTALSGNNPTDDVGESYTIEEELEIAVDQLETQAGGSITLGNGSEINSASSAVSFVIPHLVATNTTESTLTVPAASSFNLLSAGQRQDPYRVDYKDVMDSIESSISEPISGPLFPSTPEIGPEEEAEGWLVFTVPEAGETVVLELRLNDEVQFDWSLTV